jgi:hypothetical protein
MLLFELVDADNRTVIRHDVTGEFAGTIVRSTRGLITSDENSRTIGIFENLDDAIRALYDAL